MRLNLPFTSSHLYRLFVLQCVIFDFKFMTVFYFTKARRALASTQLRAFHPPSSMYAETRLSDSLTSTLLPTSHSICIQKRWIGPSAQDAPPKGEDPPINQAQQTNDRQRANDRTVSAVGIVITALPAIGTITYLFRKAKHERNDINTKKHNKEAAQKSRGSQKRLRPPESAVLACLYALDASGALSETGRSKKRKKGRVADIGRVADVAEGGRISVNIETLSLLLGSYMYAVVSI